MKKSFALILAIILMFSMAADVFADSDTQNAEPVLLTGQFGEEETIRTRAPAGSTNPFYLDKPVEQCRHAKVVLGIDQIKGDCSGYYYLYAMDFNEKWEHIGTFKVDKKRVNGNAYSYEFDLDRSSDFVAVALWPEGKSNYCEGHYHYSVYVDPACISEYSDKIPEPVFEASDVTDEYINIGFSSDPYSNPWGDAAAAAFFSLYS